jgi:hypothetical protein
MPFTKEPRYAAEVGKVFGDYLITYRSDRGQVRADLFRTGNRVAAHVSFPVGLRQWRDGPLLFRTVAVARAGFADRFQIIMS